MALYTFFVHGSSVVAEFSGPIRFLEVSGGAGTAVMRLPQGSGRIYRGKRGLGMWFHAAVPTPVQIASGIVVLKTSWYSCVCVLGAVWKRSTRGTAASTSPATTRRTRPVISAVRSSPDQGGPQERVLEAPGPRIRYWSEP